MRCIEINMSALVAIRTHGLTLTWDVLKSKIDMKYMEIMRLTLTWDVLKSREDCRIHAQIHD